MVDHARNRRALKRGGQFEITSLATDVEEHVVDDRELICMSAALDELVKLELGLAERSDGRFERRVKFLSLGVTGRGGEERFKREGSILGRQARARVSVSQYRNAGPGAGDKSLPFPSRAGHADFLSSYCVLVKISHLGSPHTIPITASTCKLAYTFHAVLRFMDPTVNW